MFDFKVAEEPRKEAPSGGLYDYIIIGAGPAGLSSAIYASRDGMKVLVLEKEVVGGLAATTELIENYPGFPEGIAGEELMERMRKQAERFGTEIVEFDEVTKVEPVKKGLIRVHTAEGETYEGKVVLLATGSQPKHLGIPGEEEFYGRGVSYCATCDGPLYKGKHVVVIGCGNSGLQEGQNLLNYASEVTFIEFLDHSPAEKILQERVMNHPKATCYFHSQVVEIKGDEKVTAVVFKDRTTGEMKEIPADGVFIYVGYKPDTEFVKDLVELNRWGYIKTDEKMRTKVEGVLAAGDVRADNLAQVTVAVSDGCKAAITTREYLAELKSEA